MATYGQIQGDLNTMNEAQKNEAVRVAGYTGWSDYQDNANRIAQGQTSMTNAQVSNPMAAPAVPGGGGSALGVPVAATLDLPGLYQSLTKDSGITDLEKRLADEQTAFNTAQSQINDNPFLSEADRVGRIQKLQIDYNANAKGTQDALAMKKADVQTQLDLASKQYDINSQASRDALSRFDSLLASGALAGASGSDIANLTSQTGLSSSMIQAAINAAKAKNIKTSTLTYDDGKEQGFMIINPDTGDIISKQKIADSRPTAAEIKAKSGGTTQSATQTKANEQADVKYLLELYKNVNKSNPSWQKAHDLRNQYSPEDFKAMLLQTYPTQTAYIKANLK